METKYETLKRKHQEEVNAFPFGFAFTNESFEKMMTKWGLHPERDRDKIIGIGAGGYVRKSDYDAMLAMFARQKAEMKALMESDENAVYKMFFRELNDHEYGYTGDPTDAIESLGYTMEEIEASPMLKKAFDKAAEEILRKAG